MRIAMPLPITGAIGMSRPDIETAHVLLGLTYLV
jgi:hypothetical protein